MKKIFLLALCLTLTATLTACEKAPTAEIDAAKASIDAAVSEGAEKYTAEQLQSINTQLTAAMVEVQSQDSKFLKKFDTAKQMLAQIKADAEVLKGQVAVVKQELNGQAVAGLEQAGSAVAEASALLENAPQGKGADGDSAGTDRFGLADGGMVVAGIDQGLHFQQRLAETGDVGLHGSDVVLGRNRPACR